MSTKIEWYQLEWGYVLQSPGGGDVIRITDVQCGTPGQIEFVLRTAPNITWAKSIKIVDTAAQFGEASTADADHGPKSLIVEVIPEALGGASLLFSKAATLGVFTGMYTVGDLLRYSGKKVEFTWFWDWGGPGAPAPVSPVPNPSCPESTGGGSSKCFVATAAYGAHSIEVLTLRAFRDQCLLPNSLGRFFVALYERLSPPAAAHIAKSRVLRAITRKLVVSPAYLIAYRCLTWRSTGRS